MSDMRIHGLALGPYGTVGMTSGNSTAKNLITPGDATPDIHLNSYWLTGNTSATTITDFEGGPDGKGPEEGKLLLINFRDSNTTITNGGNIYLAETQGAFAQNAMLALVYHNSGWYELTRSRNSQTSNLNSTINGTLRVSVGGSCSYSVNTANIVYHKTTTANCVITSLSGGVVGQETVIILDTAAIATYVANTVGNIYLGTTAAMITFGNQAALKFIKGDTYWHLIGGNSNPAY